MLILILIYCIDCGIMAEYNTSVLDFQTVTIIKLLDACILSTFVFDIALHCLDDFSTYLMDGWHVFDLLVTTVIIVSELMELGYGIASDGVKALRILCVGKMIVRLDGLRTIVMTIFQALRVFFFN